MTDAAQVRDVVQQAHTHFGKLDIVLNNAGYSSVGTVEEASEADVRAVFERFILGNSSLPMVRAAYADRLATWEAWGSVSNAAQGEPKTGAVASV